MNKFFAGIGNSLVKYSERHSRADQIERLRAKSDEELAGMGLSRDRIVHHVFRDVIYM